MKPDQTKPDVDAMQTQTSSPSILWLSPVIPTDFLFQGNQEILISHNGEHYRLRITKNGKLILTK